MPINHTVRLLPADVGNVPRSPDYAGEGEAGTAMNIGMIKYDPNATIPFAEFQALADYFTEREEAEGLPPTGVETVARWFGRRRATNVDPFRNCVPRDSLRDPASVPPGAPVRTRQGYRICRMPAPMRRRCLLACCLTVNGGLVRDPLFKGTKRGGAPYTEVDYNPLVATLAEALEFIEDLYDGAIDALIEYGWVRLKIVAQVGGGWRVVCEHNYPTRGDESGQTECDDAEEGDSTE